MALSEKDKGSECYKAGDLEEAVVYYSRSISVKETVAALNNRALAYLRLKHYAECEKDSSRVIAIEPDNTKALIRRATARKSLHRIPDAQADIDHVLKIEPQNKDALLVLKELSNHKHDDGKGKTHGTASPAEAPKKHRMVIEEVSDDEDEDEVKQDETPLSISPTQNPQSEPETKTAPPTSIPTTTAHTPARTPSPAPVQVVSKPIPPKIASLKEEGNDLFKAGNYDAARDKYTTALSVLDSQPDARDHISVRVSLLSNRAACFLKLGDSSNTIADCNAGLELDPNNLNCVLRRAVGYEMKEKLLPALDDFRTVLRLHPGHPAAADAVNRISRELRNRGIPTTSASAPAPTPTPVVVPQPVKEPQATAPSKAAQYELWKSRGNDYFKSGDFTKAIDCYAECIKIDATLAFAYNNRAFCHLKLSNYIPAIADASKVLEIEPDNTKALYRRAQAFRGVDDLTSAERDLTSVLVLDPKNTTAAFDLDAVRKALATKPKPASSVSEKKGKSRIEEVDEVPIITKPVISPVEKKQTDTQQKPAATRVRIEEVGEDGDLTPVRAEPEVKSSSSSPAKQPTPSKVPAAALPARQQFDATKLPSTPLEFMRLFVSYKNNDAGLGAVLSAINPSDVVKLFSNQLESDHLIAIGKALPHIAVERALAFTSALCKVARFDMNIKFLGKEDVANFTGLFSSAASAFPDRASEIAALKAKYGA